MSPLQDGEELSSLNSHRLKRSPVALGPAPRGNEPFTASASDTSNDCNLLNELHVLFSLT